jgi:hypothetical protein
MYGALMAAYQRVVNAQDLAEQLRYASLEEDLFQLAIEVQRMASACYEGRYPRRNRQGTLRETRAPHDGP